MATFDLTQAAALPWDGQHRNGEFFVYAEIAPTVLQCVTGSVLRCMDIPDGCVVDYTLIEMIIAATVGTSMVADVGVANSGVTGYDANGFDAAIDLEAAAKTCYQTAIGTDAYGAAPFIGYIGANALGASVDLTLTTTGAVTVAPKFRIWARMRYVADLT